MPRDASCREPRQSQWEHIKSVSIWSCFMPNRIIDPSQTAMVYSDQQLLSRVSGNHFPHHPPSETLSVNLLGIAPSSFSIGGRGRCLSLRHFYDSNRKTKIGPKRRRQSACRSGLSYKVDLIFLQWAQSAKKERKSSAKVIGGTDNCYSVPVVFWRDDEYIAPFNQFLLKQIDSRFPLDRQFIGNKRLLAHLSKKTWRLNYS